MATTVAGVEAFFESDGKAVNVTLNAGDVNKGAVVYVDGWLGIAGEDALSGETLALIADDREYQFTVPAGLTVAKGAIVYITVATVTGHYPDDEAYTTTAGAGKWAFFKATAAKDANNIVTGVMIAHNALLS
jgi:predicted RecA/RadA family phage recombinase